MKLRSFLLAGFLFLALPLASSFSQVGISINIAPPVLPVYEQPLCPAPGYIWTPGYWAWATGGYYWVPGVWVAPPRVGLLWTPAWWGWNNGAYIFHQGYWGPTVGFYGGINYGHGYWGNGYWGGRWVGNTFRYNTAVTRVNTTVIHNTYVDRTVVNKEVNRSRTSFNGPNGVKAKPTAQQKAAAANAKRMPPTSQQLARKNAAAKDPKLQASNNKGRPNADAIKSFNKSERAGQGQRAKGLGTAAGAGKAGNKPGNVTERNRHGARAGNTRANANKIGAGNQGNTRTGGGNQAKMHTGKMAGHQGSAQGQHAMNQQVQRRQQVGGQQKTGTQRRPQQMGGQPHAKMQGGGNRPRPGGQQQGKKKEGKPEKQHGRR
jgi:hypothetical protein